MAEPAVRCKARYLSGKRQGEQCTSEAKPSSDYCGKHWFGEKHTGDQLNTPQCEALFASGARKGQRCDRKSAHQSKYCAAHSSYKGPPKPDSVYRSEPCRATLASGAKKGSMCGGKVLEGEKYCTKHKLFDVPKPPKTKCPSEPAADHPDQILRGHDGKEYRSTLHPTSRKWYWRDVGKPPPPPPKSRPKTHSDFFEEFLRGFRTPPPPPNAEYAPPPKTTPFKSDEWYQVLGLRSSASPKEVRIAYLKLAQKLHPDHATDQNRVENAEKFKNVAAAYDGLKRLGKAV